MKQFITMLLITSITIAALPNSVKAGNAKETERKTEISRSWGSDYDAASVQTAVTQETVVAKRVAVEMMSNWEGYHGATSAQSATAYDTTGAERTAETAKNWGGLCD